MRERELVSVDERGEKKKNQEREKKKLKRNKIINVGMGRTWKYETVNIYIF